MNRTAFGQRLAYLWAATILCSFPVGLMVLGNLLLAQVPQVQEFLRAFNGGLGGTGGFYPVRQFLVLELVLFLWSLSVWYTCRLLLGYHYAGGMKVHVLDDLDDPGIQFLRTWLPRLWGVLASGLIPLWYLGANYYQLSGLHWGMALLFALPALAALVFMLARRRLIQMRLRAGRTMLGAGDVMVQRLASSTRWVLIVTLLVSFVFVILFSRMPTAVGEALGAPAILFMAMASWALFGGVVLTLLPKTYGWPGLILLPVVFAVIASHYNDNHRLRSVSGSAASGPAPQDQRPFVADRFKAWLEARSGGSTAAAEVPVFVVASAGGGIRAAYWTASVLARIDQDTQGWLGCHIFAISGVSGGSLGAAAYVAALADNPATAACGSNANHQRAVSDNLGRLQKFLGEDYLSPAIGSMLFPDAVQRFIPGDIFTRDRAYAMEVSWEKHWGEYFDAAHNHFAQRFLDLYANDQTRLPYLFLNAASVDQGKRVVQSALRIADGDPTDGYDLMQPDIDAQDMPLSTAVDNSARFTYVAPAGSVYWRANNGPKPTGNETPPSHNHDADPFWGRLVDGGYFDNSGATTAREIVDAVRHREPNSVPVTTTRYRIIAVQITNDSSAPSLCDSKDQIQGPASNPSGLLKAPALSELSAPPAALINGREGRSTFSQLQLIQAVSADTANCQNFWPISMPAAANGDPALGWYLSKRTDQDWQGSINSTAATFEARLCQTFSGSPGLSCPMVPSSQ